MRILIPVIVATAVLTDVGLMSVRAAGQTSPRVQEFPLTDTHGLVAMGTTVEPAEFLGRKAVRLLSGPQGGSVAMLSGTDFQDGIIEADVAVKILTPPAVRMPGFIGLGFRATPDGSNYDQFYIRPRNATADDQAMRNHAAQYTAEPRYGWYQLRRDWPWVYEAHADLKVEAWTHMRIEVAGRAAKLYLNGSGEPTLIVDGLKGENLRGGVLLFGYQGEEAYFSSVRITNMPPQAVRNGSDPSGTWQVKVAMDAGVLDGTLRLDRNGGVVSGTWSGTLAPNATVTGTWRDGYVELSFPVDWPKAAGIGTPGPAIATLAGWIDGESGKGRGKIEAHADGIWTATKKQ
jgi:hypothetical protein